MMMANLSIKTETPKEERLKIAFSALKKVKRNVSVEWWNESRGVYEVEYVDLATEGDLETIKVKKADLIAHIEANTTRVVDVFRDDIHEQYYDDSSTETWLEENSNHVSRSLRDFLNDQPA